jgi:lipopolysaccharide export system protein LptA
VNKARKHFKLVVLSSALLASPSAIAFAAPTSTPAPPPTHPPSAAPSAGATLNDPGVYTISGQNLTWNQRNGDFTIPSDVKFTQPGTDVTGDHATGNSITKSVKITGHVILHNAKPVSTVGITAKTASSDPQTLTSDELDVDGPTKNYTAIGDVKFTQGTKVVTAARGQLDQLKHMLVLTGDVHIDDTSTGQSMIADNVTYDTASETVTATGKPGAPFQIRAPVQTAPPGTPAPTKPPKKRR